MQKVCACAWFDGYVWQGVVELVSDFTVCKAGDALTPNQAALLRVFEIKQAAFHVTPICQWQAEGKPIYKSRS